MNVAEAEQILSSRKLEVAWPNEPLLGGYYGEEEMEVINKTIRDSLDPTRGFGFICKEIEDFEAALAEYCGTADCVTVNGAGSGLDMTLMCLDLRPEDEVIVPSVNFRAALMAVLGQRAKLVLCEVDPQTLCADVADVERKLTPQTVAIAPVHMAGMSCDMDPLLALARRHNLKVIEDTAQAGGATYHGRRLGTIGDMGCFSLDYYKTFVSGEGGVVCTDDEWLDTRAQSYHDTAACWRPDRYAQERRPGELFCGENYRMSELAAAVALAQLRKVDERCRRWRQAKQRILSQLAPQPGLHRQPSHDEAGEAAYTLTFFAPTAELASQVSAALAAEGVGAGGGYSDKVRDWHVYSYWEQILERKTATAEGCPFTCPFYAGQQNVYTPDMCPQTLDWLSRAVRLGINGGWTEDDCDQVAAAINKVAAVYLS